VHHMYTLCPRVYIHVYMHNVGKHLKRIHSVKFIVILYRSNSY
jgi:hypothetical protein